jgi:hypothetical protein
MPSRGTHVGGWTAKEIHQASSRSTRNSCLKAGCDGAVRQFCLIDIDLAQQIKCPELGGIVGPFSGDWFGNCALRGLTRSDSFPVWFRAVRQYQ